MPIISLLQMGVGAVAAFALSWILHTADVERLERGKAVAVAAQIAADIATCDKDKALTKETNDDLQAKRDAISAKRAAFNSLQLPSCITPISSVSTNVAAGRPGHAGRNGLRAEWLWDYAARCETYRQERVSLEHFIAAERR